MASVLSEAKREMREKKQKVVEDLRQLRCCLFSMLRKRQVKGVCNVPNLACLPFICFESCPFLSYYPCLRKRDSLLRKKKR